MSLPPLQRLNGGILRQKPTEKAKSCQLKINKMIEISDEDNEFLAACDLKAAGQPILENKIGLLGAKRILFGQYAGQTFKFLVENDLGYIIHLLESEENQRGTGREVLPWKEDNKSSLRKYVELLPEYPEILDLIEYKREQRRLPLPERDILFGEHEGKKVSVILNKKGYCEWMMQQGVGRCEQFNEILKFLWDSQLQ